MKSITRNSLFVSINILISRIFGFLREVTIAHFFGATLSFDAFVIGFRIPNLLRSLFTEGSFLQGFIPLLSIQENEGESSFRRFIGSVSGVFLLFFFFITIIGIIFAPLLISIFAPGFQKNVEQFKIAVIILRICFPYLPLIFLIALFAALLNYRGKFFLSSFIPIILNLFLICGAAVSFYLFRIPIIGLAFAVPLAGLCQLTVLAVKLRRERLLIRPKLNFQDSVLKSLIMKMIPIILVVSIFQINLTINSFFASFLPNGSISWLYYSSRIINLPIGIVAVALTTVSLPSLIKSHFKEDQKEFNRLIRWGSEIIIFFGSFASIFLILFSTPIIDIIYHHGAFLQKDLVATSEAVRFYAIGLLPMMLSKFLLASLTAQGKFRLTISSALISLFSNLTLNFIFFHSRDLFLSRFPIEPHSLLALSNSIASLITLISILLLSSRNRKNSFEIRKKDIVRILFPILIFLALISFLAPSVQKFLTGNSLETALFLLIIGLVSFATYFFLFLIFGYRFPKIG